MMYPEKFVQEKPKAYTMLREDGTPIARIPEMKDRIREDDHGNISLVIGRETDAETGEIQEETVVIGHDVSGHLPGMMLTTEAYLDYFDLLGVLHTDPMRKDTSSDQNESVGDCPQVTHSNQCRRQWHLHPA